MSLKEQTNRKIALAKQAIAEEKKDKAHQILLDIIRVEEESIEAWWLLSEVTDNRQDKLIYLENILDLDDHHEKAWQKLKELDLKTFIERRMLLELGEDYLSLGSREEIRRHFEGAFNSILAYNVSMVFAKAERQRLFEGVMANIIGFGPLEILLDAESINSIFVQGIQNIFVERKDKWTKANLEFDNQGKFNQIIDKMIEPLGNVLDDNSPIVNTRLPDGGSVHIVAPPASSEKTIVTMRKYDKNPLAIQDLISSGTLTPEIAEFLRACMIAKVKVLVVGSTGAGKNTLVNVLSGFIANDERIITVERVAELQLQQDHVLTLEGLTLLPMETLLKHRPDNLIFGEIIAHEIPNYIDACLSVPTYGMMRARNTKAALRQLEIGLLTSMPEASLLTIRNLITSAIDIVVELQLLPDGSRKLVQIIEIQQVQNGLYDNQTLFKFEAIGQENGKVIGRIPSTGQQPSFMKQIENDGIHLPPSIFGL